MTEVIVQVVGAASGISTPHDGRWVVAWNPNSKYGILLLTSTADRTLARRFESPEQVLIEWKTMSKRNPFRPDGKINRPLTGLTIAMEAAE